jgi:hypothetical protein
MASKASPSETLAWRARAAQARRVAGMLSPCDAQLAEANAVECEDQALEASFDGPDLHVRPLRSPSQIQSLTWSEGVHPNNSSFVRIGASRPEGPLMRGLTTRTACVLQAPSPVKAKRYAGLRVIMGETNARRLPSQFRSRALRPLDHKRKFMSANKFRCSANTYSGSGIDLRLWLPRRPASPSCPFANPTYESSAMRRRLQAVLVATDEICRNGQCPRLS